MITPIHSSGSGSADLVAEAGGVPTASARLNLPELQRQVIFAAEEGLVDRHRERRVSYWLRKKNLRLHIQRNGYFAVSAITTLAAFHTESLIAMEAWARGRA